MCGWFFFFKQKAAYEMRISDWSSDVCSSDLRVVDLGLDRGPGDVRGRQAGGGELGGVLGQPHADGGLVETDLGGSVGTDAGVAGEGEQRSGGERVPGDGDHHRLGVAEDAHEDPPAGTAEGAGAPDPSRHLGEVEPRRELAGTPDAGDRKSTRLNSSP